MATADATLTISVYDDASERARRAIVNIAVREAQQLLAQGRLDDALAVLYAPPVVRAATALTRKNGDT